MLVTPEGLKVFPEDVEAVLNRLPGVRESAVIGHDRVHAVLNLNPGANAEDIVRRANSMLEEHQKIRMVSVWPGPSSLAPGHGKAAKGRNRDRHRTGRIAAGGEAGNGSGGSGREIRARPEDQADTTIAELGLSSLDRVELLMDLEEKLGTSLSESAFASEPN